MMEPRHAMKYFFNAIDYVTASRMASHTEADTNGSLLPFMRLRLACRLHD